MLPNESQRRSVHELPSVRRLLLPALVSRILPQQPRLPRSVSRVPQCVAQELSGSSVRVDRLQLDSGLRDGAERSRLPVRLRVLLPHDSVEVRRVLVAEDESRVIVVHV